MSSTKYRMPIRLWWISKAEKVTIDMGRTNRLWRGRMQGASSSTKMLVKRWTSTSTSSGNSSAVGWRKAMASSNHRNVFSYQFGGRPQHNHQQQQQPQQRGGINMLHIFILVSIGMSILPKFFESAPFFSFNQTAEFPIARQTSVLKARYYAGSEFQKLVQGKPQKLLELEQKVDAEFYKHLYHEC